MRKRYPLEPLIRLRREKFDRRARELGEAERQATSERTALESVRKLTESTELRARAESEVERTRLEQGLERVQDLTRAELHRMRERLRIEALAAAERSAAEKSERAERVVTDARAALGTARADARVLERAGERFHRAAERGELAAEEQAASEFRRFEVPKGGHAARRGRKGRA